MLATLGGSLNQDPLLWLLLSSILGGIIGASIKFGFEDLLRPFVGSRREARRVVSKYTTPLLRSAEALERRINIMINNEAHRWFETDEYFRLSTLYVFGEYLGWVRIVEQSFGFLPFESSRKGGKFNRRLNGIFRALSSHAYFRTEPEDAVGDSLIERFKLTAIGEMMIGVDQGKVIEYTDFVQRYRSDMNYKSWFADLEAFLEKATPSDSLRWDRLILTGAHLRVLICFLDPRGAMVPWRKASNLERLYHAQIIESLRRDFPKKLIRSPEELETARKIVAESDGRSRRVDPVVDASRSRS